jgi:hypothetical protein
MFSRSALRCTVFGQYGASHLRRSARHLVRDYDGDAGAVWRDVADGKELERRLLGLPGIGEMKTRTMIGILAKRFGVRPAGWEAVAPQHMSLADVDSPEKLGRIPGRQACPQGRIAGGRSQDFRWPRAVQTHLKVRLRTRFGLKAVTIGSATGERRRSEHHNLAHADSSWTTAPT